MPGTKHMGFCISHLEGEIEPEVLDCYELSLEGPRVPCPYSERHIQLRTIEGHAQLYIPPQEGLPGCLDFVPTSETNSRLIAKLSPQPNL